MENVSGIANFVVKYNSDPRLVTDNHKSDIVYLLDVDERGFKYQCDAIRFLDECTMPITTIEELVPELRNCKKFKFLLKEKNIKVKHQVTGHAEEDFLDDAIDWT